MKPAVRLSALTAAAAEAVALAQPRQARKAVRTALGMDNALKPCSSGGGPC